MCMIITGHVDKYKRTVYRKNQVPEVNMSMISKPFYAP